jgi:hypothetical protein
MDLNILFNAYFIPIHSRIPHTTQQESIVNKLQIYIQQVQRLPLWSTTSEQSQFKYLYSVECPESGPITLFILLLLLYQIQDIRKGSHF